MSLKGKQFTPKDLPRAAQARWPRERQAEWAARETARYAIVAMDGETPLIAEELDQRALNKLSPKARRIAGLMLSADADVRREVLRAFDADSGALQHPFKPG